MSNMKVERSPRTLLSAATALRNVLYESNGRSEELVIESPHTSTGFILSKVEGVLLDIRKDLGVLPACDGDAFKDRQLMLRIRDHTNVIGETLTGVPLSHDGETSTIVQLQDDLEKLCLSVSSGRVVSCVIL